MIWKNVEIVEKNYEIKKNLEKYKMELCKMKKMEKWKYLIRKFKNEKNKNLIKIKSEKREYIYISHFSDHV